MIIPMMVSNVNGGTNNTSTLLCYIPEALVGLETNSYTFSEDDEATEICVRVLYPVIEVPIGFPFSIQLTTSDGTAG